MHATLPPVSNRVAAWGLAVLLLYFGSASLARPLQAPYAWSDFVTFYSAAQAFADSRSAYEPLQLRGDAADDYRGWVGRYFYPPPFAAVVVRPLLALPFDVARRVWVLVEAVAYLAAGVLLTQLVFGSLQLRALACTGVLFLPFAPMSLDLRLGSVSALMLLLTCLFLRHRERRQETRAALALAAAIVLKLTPALLAAYLLVLGERRLVLRTLACIALLLVAALPWTGVQAYRTYALDTLPFLASANFSWFTNQSIDAFFWRLFVVNPDTTPWVESLATQRICTLLGSLAVVGVLFRVARRERASANSRAPVWGVALVLVGSLLLARVSWEYMLLLALPAFTLALRDALSGAFALRTLLVLTLAYALCAAPIPYTTAAWREGWALLLLTPRFYGLVVLFAVSSSHRLRRAVAPAA